MERPLTERIIGEAMRNRACWKDLHNYLWRLYETENIFFKKSEFEESIIRIIKENSKLFKDTMEVSIEGVHIPSYLDNHFKLIARSIYYE
jgi:hypothetical protein